MQSLNDAYDRFPDARQRRVVRQRPAPRLHQGHRLRAAQRARLRRPGVRRAHRPPAWLPHVRHWAARKAPTCRASSSTSTSPPAAARRPPSRALRRPRRVGADPVRRIATARSVAARSTCWWRLRDIGPGDGATMIVPGSHKSNFMHPLAGDYFRGDRMDTLPFADEVYANAGDALVFVDACMHGGSTRINDGERRVVILRYGPPWARPRFGYTLSPSSSIASRPRAPDHAAHRPAAQRATPGAHRSPHQVPVRGWTVECRLNERGRLVAFRPCLTASPPPTWPRSPRLARLDVDP